MAKKHVFILAIVGVSLLVFSASQLLGGSRPPGIPQYEPPTLYAVAVSFPLAGEATGPGEVTFTVNDIGRSVCVFHTSVPKAMTAEVILDDALDFFKNEGFVRSHMMNDSTLLVVKIQGIVSASRVVTAPGLR